MAIYPNMNPSIPMGMNVPEMGTNQYGVPPAAPQAIMEPPRSYLPSLYQNRAALGGMPSYAMGGSVSNIRDLARGLSQYGTGNDTILAHISPREAEFLSQTEGGRRNPITGLPEYGFFENFIPLLAGAVGSMIAGPIGGIAAGALTGGAIGAGGSDKPGRGALRGALQGGGLGGLGAAGLGLLGPMIGGGGAGMAGGMGGGIPGLSSIFGGGLGRTVPGAQSLARGKLMSALPQMGQGSSGMSGMSGIPGFGSSFGSLFGGAGGGGGGSSLLDTALLGLGLGGTLFGKRSEPKPQKQYTEDNLMIPEHKWRADQMPGPISPLIRNPNFFHPDVFKAGEIPEHKFFSHGGYYEGREGGQADTIESRVEPGDYIWDADAVGMLGDGNSHAGASMLHNVASSLNKPNAYVSPGEFRFTREQVTNLGNGDNRRGASILKTTIENMRSHKRSSPKNKIPPKSKSFDSYLPKRRA